MTKFLSDDWMYENGFIDEKEVIDNYTPKLVPNRAWGQDKKISDMPLHKSINVYEDEKVGTVINQMVNFGFNQLPVINKEDKIIGVVTTESLIAQLSKGKVTKESPLGK